MIMSFHQNAEENHNLLTANKSLGNVVEFKCLGIIEIGTVFTKTLRAD
jgi:hypothetical protein